MGHPIRAAELWGEVLAQDAAPAIRVRRTGPNQLELAAAGIHFVWKGTRVAPLPDRVKVVNVEGEVVRPSRGRFYITLDTEDPEHVICDGRP